MMVASMFSTDAALSMLQFTLPHGLEVVQRPGRETHPRKYFCCSSNIFPPFHKDDGQYFTFFCFSQYFFFVS